MLATGELKEIKKGDALDFRSSGLDGPHRTLGENFPADGIGAWAPCSMYSFITHVCIF